eukprot:761183-Hanusia_phi.AAC.3
MLVLVDRGERCPQPHELRGRRVPPMKHGDVQGRGVVCRMFEMPSAWRHTLLSPRLRSSTGVPASTSIST